MANPVSDPTLESPTAGAHRRFDPLLKEWVLVSPQRISRPWHGQTEDGAPPDRPTYDPNCYLCPGNRRAGGVQNPAYDAVFVFDNDFSALRPALPDVPALADHGSSVLIAAPERGICRVVCFTPRHDLTMADMEPAQIHRVVEAWVSQCQELAQLPHIHYVQVFENKGALMGCSNPHPHGQIWATESVPTIVAREQDAQSAYQRMHGSCLLCHYVSQESHSEERTVAENDHFMAVVPFWARWPFETLLITKHHCPSLSALNAAQRLALSEILARLTRTYDQLFGVSFPYSMGFHQCPSDGQTHTEWHLHAHFYPPLLRSASIRKFMVGYEMLAEPQRDLTPEQAAQFLQKVSAAAGDTKAFPR
jgi:UDPglucose--hexose-1-phosphate uridylyltransferase